METLVIAVVVIAVLYFFFSSKSKAAETQNSKQLEEETQKYVTELQRIGDDFEKSGIPMIESDISHKKGETLHVKFGNIQWMEYRKKRTGYTIHGVTARVKIAKGLYYRAGSGQVISESVDQLTPVDKGDIYFTNKGIFFRGSLGNKTLPYDKIVMLTPFQQGLKIEKGTGKDIYIPYNIRPDQGAAIALLWDKVRNENG